MRNHLEELRTARHYQIGVQDMAIQPDMWPEQVFEFFPNVLKAHRLNAGDEVIALLWMDGLPEIEVFRLFDSSRRHRR